MSTLLASLSEFLLGLPLWLHVTTASFALYKIYRFILLRSNSDYTNKIVLVTGGGQGIGRQICLEFARLGASIVVWDVQEDKAQETVQLIAQQFGVKAKAKAYRVDVCDVEGVPKIAQQVVADMGRVDVLINNAGICFGKDIINITNSQLQRIFNVNSIANWTTTKCFLPEMMEKNDGHIVTVCSVVSYSCFPSMVDYSASKFAAFSFAEGLRQELAIAGKNGVHTTIVCPYFINTGMFTGVKPNLLARLVCGDFLEEKYVIRRIVEAVRCKDLLVTLPDRLGWIMPFARLLPVFAYDYVQKILDIGSAMRTFHGRGDAANMGQVAAAAGAKKAN